MKTIIVFESYEELPPDAKKFIDEAGDPSEESYAKAINGLREAGYEVETEHDMEISTISRCYSSDGVGDKELVTYLVKKK